MMFSCSATFLWLQSSSRSLPLLPLPPAQAAQAASGKAQSLVAEGAAEGAGHVSEFRYLFYGIFIQIHTVLYVYIYINIYIYIHICIIIYYIYLYIYIKYIKGIFIYDIFRPENHQQSDIIAVSENDTYKAYFQLMPMHGENDDETRFCFRCFPHFLQPIPIAKLMQGTMVGYIY